MTPGSSATPSPSLFIQTLQGEASAIPPIWFMRQAGRYLPEYREVRQQAGSFLDLCYNSELAAEVTLQPIRRYDLDAAILFADILLIPHAMGQNVWFEQGEGPRLDPPVTQDHLDSFRASNIRETLSPVYETVRRVRASLSADKALIGFAGAPWTVATYMLAGGSQKDPAAWRAEYYQNPGFLLGLIDLLTEKTIEYLCAQIDAGADAIQLFDSWASDLPWPVLEAVSMKPMDRIARAVKAHKADTPVIFFPKGVGEKAMEYALLGSGNAVGIDFGMDPAWARTNLSPHVTVQGGLDPLLTVSGGDAMFESASTYLKLFHDAPYVFNLGHGFTPQTPPENVAALIDFVRSGEGVRHA
ncbi:MAG: uroporphyrinogen decarboxylase [Pseudomonadota bacterium]